MIESTKTNWYCIGCSEPHYWYSVETDCCGVFTRSAWMEVPCAFCSDLNGFMLCTDGYTRACACQTFVSNHQNNPNDQMVEGLSAMMLCVIVNRFILGAFIEAVPHPKKVRY